MTKGKVKTWIPSTKQRRYLEAVGVLGGCLSAADFAGVEKLRWLFGCPDVAPAQAVTRRQFDEAVAVFLDCIGRAIPNKLTRLVLALRHEMLSEAIEFKQDSSHLVCLFPIAPGEPKESWSLRYAFESGWRTDRLFHWCGQRKGTGHREVQRALEDCSGPQCAVLVFRRDSQRSPHTFVGRARGYLPLCDQDVASEHPFQAALMLDTVSPVRTDDATIEPGWQSPAANKQSVWEALHTDVHGRYRMQGYSISRISGDVV